MFLLFTFLPFSASYILAGMAYEKFCNDLADILFVRHLQLGKESFFAGKLIHVASLNCHDWPASLISAQLNHAVINYIYPQIVLKQ